MSIFKKLFGFRSRGNKQKYSSSDKPVDASSAQKPKLTHKYKKNQDIELFYRLKTFDLEKVKIAIEAGANINAKNRSGETPLMIAVRHGKEEAAELFIAKGADVQAADRDEETPLNAAIKNGDENFIRLLIRSGGDVQAPGKSGESPLNTAINRRDEKTVKLLVEEGAKVNAIDEEGRSPLLLACYTGNHELIEFLRNSGAEPAGGERITFEPDVVVDLFDKGNMAIMEYLLEAGASLDYQDIHGGTLLEFAVRKKNEKLVRLLLDNKVRLDLSRVNGNTPLIFACINGSIQIVRMLLDAGIDVNKHGYEGNTALNVALIEKTREIAVLLMRAGADVNAPAKNGTTAVALAASRGYVQILRLLIKAGAEVDTQNVDGLNALTVACEQGHVKVVEVLLSTGCDLNVTTKAGETAMMIATRNENNSIKKLLVEKGVDISSGSDNALINACLSGDIDSVRKELGRTPDINKVVAGKTPLSAACLKGHENIVGLLLASGATITRRNDTSLADATSSGNAAIVKMILNNQPDVNRARDGWPPLTIASMSDGSYRDILPLLMDAGADVNLPNNQLDTPLHIAADRGYYNNVGFLLNAGADVSIENGVKRTPLESVLWRQDALGFIEDEEKRSFTMTVEQLQHAERKLKEGGKDGRSSESDTTVSSGKHKWIKAALANPRVDRWVNIPIREMSELSGISTDEIKKHFGFDSGKAIELFEAMVAGQCLKCKGVISGEQILQVGVYQRVDGVLSTSEFYITLAKGKCPGCASTRYGIKWIGNNW